MANKKVSIKHLQINKSQSTMMAVVIGSIVFCVFGLFATRAIIAKGVYNRRVLHARRDVVKQLKDNYDAAKTLFNQYDVFANADPNILGGSKDGSTNIDGPNPRIVLDALPSTYDAPALASSLEKLLTQRSISIGGIQVTDDPALFPDQPQANPKPQAITFSFTGTTNYQGALQILSDFEHSIRPFDINTLDVSGTDSKLQLSVGMTTYMQAAKNLDLTPTREVK